jgi:hypothetical protein
MELIPIEVSCYAGCKADEYPLRFTWFEKEFRVTEIIDRWYQTDRDPEVPPADFYKVKAHDGGMYILKHNIKEDLWLLVI